MRARASRVCSRDVEPPAPPFICGEREHQQACEQGERLRVPSFEAPFGLTLRQGRESRRRNHVLFTDELGEVLAVDRKSTRLNSSHVRISYAVFCLKKKK